MTPQSPSDANEEGSRRGHINLPGKRNTIDFGGLDQEGMGIKWIEWQTGIEKNGRVDSGASWVQGRKLLQREIPGII